MKLSKLTLLSAMMLCAAATLFGQAPLYPTDITIDSSDRLFMTEKGSRRVAVYAKDGTSLLKSFSLSSVPTGIAVDRQNIYVTTFGDQGRLEVFDQESGKGIASVETGSGACSPIVNPLNGKIYVCNRYQGTVSEIDGKNYRLKRTVKVLREPVKAVVSKGGKYLIVANFLPAQRADVAKVSACVSVIDLGSFKKIKDIRLANGSNAVRGLCLSPDGQYVYVAHNLGRFTLPTTQLQQGWMNTSVLSVISLKTLEVAGTAVLDDPERGAAGIWDVACDDRHIYVSHSGVHEISVIDHRQMLDRLAAYPDKEKMKYDLNFIYGIRRRIPLDGNGPREMCLMHNRLVIPTYFADKLNFYDVCTDKLTSVDLNPGRVETAVDKGEKYFNDASHCFQNWQSCNGCHPNDGRTDGMNWDNLNDGIGNPKNCKSLLFSHATAPSMISGIRESAELAVRAGFKYIQFFNVSEEDALCVDSYLKSLKPVPSPYLVNGKLSAKAIRGKKVFNKLKCSQCHYGDYYTDKKLHRIGSDIEFSSGWDTPTLREVWRTAPYLFDGRAATMEEVFSVHGHGINKKVSQKDIEALTEYVNSL